MWNPELMEMLADLVIEKHEKEAFETVGASVELVNIVVSMQ